MWLLLIQTCNIVNFCWYYLIEETHSYPQVWTFPGTIYKYLYGGLLKSVNFLLRRTVEGVKMRFNKSRAGNTHVFNCNSTKLIHTVSHSLTKLGENEINKNTHRFYRKQSCNFTSHAGVYCWTIRPNY